MNFESWRVGRASAVFAALTQKEQGGERMVRCFKGHGRVQLAAAGTTATTRVRPFTVRGRRDENCRGSVG
jgi:hypothetical protein